MCFFSLFSKTSNSSFFYSSISAAFLNSGHYWRLIQVASSHSNKLQYKKHNSIHLHAFLHFCLLQIFEQSFCSESPNFHSSFLSSHGINNNLKEKNWDCLNGTQAEHEIVYTGFVLFCIFCWFRFISEQWWHMLNKWERSLGRYMFIKKCFLQGRDNSICF